MKAVLPDGQGNGVTPATFLSPPVTTRDHKKQKPLERIPTGVAQLAKK
ncbi:MAG: hypothetical protein KBF88_11295 [Polyangiaceae bacterium]|nr:hypothetical protein [Polyangiaceae bacterium]